MHSHIILAIAIVILSFAAWGHEVDSPIHHAEKPSSSGAKLVVHPHGKVTIIVH